MLFVRQTQEAEKRAAAFKSPLVSSEISLLDSDDREGSQQPAPSHCRFSAVTARLEAGARVLAWGSPVPQPGGPSARPGHSHRQRLFPPSSVLTAERVPRCPLGVCASGWFAETVEGTQACGEGGFTTRPGRARGAVAGGWPWAA